MNRHFETQTHCYCTADNEHSYVELKRDYSKAGCANQTLSLGLFLSIVHALTFCPRIFTVSDGWYIGPLGPPRSPVDSAGIVVLTTN